MDKRIVIKIGSGTLATGYTAAVQVGSEGAPPQVEVQAGLPSAKDLAQCYYQWQRAYWQMGLPSRLEALSGETNFSDVSRLENCRKLSRQLRDRVRHWLNSPEFQPIREKILEQLSPTDTARILLQTSDPLLQRIPWYELDFFQRYRNAEVGICPVAYQQVYYSGSRCERVRILAVLGDDTGLDTTIDRVLLENLAGADIHFLDSPNCQTFTKALWDEQGWDILFFAGHSSSYSQRFSQEPTQVPSPEYVQSQPECSGEIWLNPSEKLTISQLRHALQKAIDRGLNTAIFNSCDGLGLASDLADLHIPQVLVMREPVPDQVAHAFLQGFLESFSNGTPFYTAVREAREKLQGMESRFPCATWLPVIIQNLAETPPTWQSLQGPLQTAPQRTVDSSDLATVPLPVGLSASNADPNLSGQLAPEPVLQDLSISKLSFFSKLKVGLGCGLAVASILTTGRLFGLLEPLEIKGYDYSLRTRPTELPDSRILIVTNTTKDIAAFPNTTGKSSLSDDTLLTLLDKLTSANPAAIGLDIYHGHDNKLPALKQKIHNTENLIAICKEPFYTDEETLVREPPPPEIEDMSRIGANDFVAFSKRGEILRRHLLQLSQASNSLCPSNPSDQGAFVNTFSTVVAFKYLADADMALEPFFLTERFGGYHSADAGGTQLLLNYRITHDPKQTNCGSVRETPAECLTVSELLAKDPQQLRSIVEDKIILIGTTDMDYAAGDRWRTPYTKSPYVKTDEVPGVFLNAQMISQLISHALDERPLIGSWAEWQEVVWIAIWALLGGLIGAYSTRRLYALVYLLLAGSLLLLMSWLWLVRLAVWVPWVPSVIALPTATLTSCAASQRKLSSKALHPRSPAS
ncbi:CHASE2 domain-containing protein [cf. Phormidesmis sp. LEGE 11477]|uniref:CHASE2 domain-containing protein n=1 Tax=cf. Phormidesmis sp. LEGE 11477 TaxID=1828680 RepID=UPI0018804A8A|nr:CHASE2 domain-containing protein [cf. Phormidesmis sp. LEGE 11477]MBE9059487.1 CHASE2 domain-containing protein [cf. Phormidesmis sp. LEGE 11477]